MWSILRRIRRAEDGAAATELALLSPFLIAGLVGLMDFGIAMGVRLQLQKAAHIAEMAAVEVGENPASINSYLLAAGLDEDILNDGTFAVTVTSFCTCGNSTDTEADCSDWCSTNVPPGNFLRITITINHETMFDWPGVNNPLVISTTQVVQVHGG